MKEATLLLASLFALYMAWRGYRRGALATLTGWMPSLLALSTLVLFFWLDPEPFSLVIGGIAASVLFVIGVSARRVWRRWLDRRVETLTPESRLSHWLRRCDGVAGAGLGLLCSVGACVGFVCLSSTVPFIYAVRAQTSTTSEKTDEPPAWVTTLRETCVTLADLSDSTVLHQVPRLHEYGQEVRALITILNSPPDDLERIAEIHGLTRIKDLPAVKAALIDKHYAELFLSLKEGDITAVPKLVDSPITRELIECPEIRDLTRTLTPSSLAQDLSTPEPAEQEAERSTDSD